MKRIGLTSTGSVIVEMSVAEYNESLASSQPPKIKAQPAVQPDASRMTTPERVLFVKDRIIKLKPKKRDGVVHSIPAMFQFTGGITEPEIQKVITSLQKEGFLTIGPDEKVKYTTA